MKTENSGENPWSLWVSKISSLKAKPYTAYVRDGSQLDGMSRVLLDDPNQTFRGSISLERQTFSTSSSDLFFYIFKFKACSSSSSSYFEGKRGRRMNMKNILTFFERALQPGYFFVSNMKSQKNEVDKNDTSFSTGSLSTCRI